MKFMMATPFEDDTLIMKMCVELYEKHEYAKLYQLMHNILASEYLLNHPFRPILLAMSSIFTCIRLGKKDEGLCLAKLNMYKNGKYTGVNEQYLQKNEENDNNKLGSIEDDDSILKREVRLSHIGFCYYNLARTEYLQYDQTIYLVKSIEYLEQSCENNYTARFTLAKCYAKQNLLDKALYHIKESLRLNKFNINGFLMLALIYSAKQELNKSELIINQLLEDYPDQPNIYICKAFLEAEKQLWKNEKNPNIESADQVGKGIRDFILEERIQSKEVNNILWYMMLGCLGIIKPEILKDQTYEIGQDFTATLPKLSTLQENDIDPQKYIDYKNSLSLFIDLLFALEYYEPIIEINDKIKDGNKKNKNEYNYNKGQLFEKYEKNYEGAIEQYENVIKEDFYNFKTMTQLALMYLKYFPDDLPKRERASELLIAASKNEYTMEICYGFGLLYEKMGDIEKSNHYLIKALQISKSSPFIPYEVVPDQLFNL